MNLLGSMRTGERRRSQSGPTRIRTRELTKLRFDALAGYSRSPYLPLAAEELEWFEAGDETVLGVLSQDRADHDFVATVLGRDRLRQFRAISCDINLPTKSRARKHLQTKLRFFAQQPPESFYQGDETGEPIDFFRPVVAKAKQHRIFKDLLQRPQLPARGLLAELMHYYRDVDGNFIEQFQSTGLDARTWELYLYATLVELGYSFEHAHPAPDFHCIGLRGEFFVEATTINPSAQGPVIDDTNREAYFADYVPQKFGSALFSKLQKRYWELPHVQGQPLLLAIQDFHAPQAMAWSSAALPEYLYGIRQIEQQIDGRAEVVSIHVEEYSWQGKRIPAGFFRQPDTEHISAVLANPAGTVTKFNRMGYLAGFGTPRINMIRKGLCYRRSRFPESFVADVTSREYTETWVEGLSVYHNPRALNPLRPTTFPGAAHHTARDGRIITRMPSFFPVGSITHIVIPHGTHRQKDKR